MPGIPPPIPGCPPGAAGASSSSSATTHSVVNNNEATEAAFCKAVRTTLAGSITPAATSSSYLPVAALKPKSSFPALTLSLYYRFLLLDYRL